MGVVKNGGRLNWTGVFEKRLPFLSVAASSICNSCALLEQQLFQARHIVGEYGEGCIHRLRCAEIDASALQRIQRVERTAAVQEVEIALDRP